MADEKETRFNVEKAAELDLKPGESLDAFRRALCDAVSKRLREHFALGEKSWIWVADVFGDAAVGEISKSDMPGKRALYQVSWARTNGEFAIGDPVEVVRRVTYVPKSKALVQKSMGMWSGLL